MLSFVCVKFIDSKEGSLKTTSLSGVNVFNQRIGRSIVFIMLKTKVANWTTVFEPHSGYECRLNGIVLK